MINEQMLRAFQLKYEGMSYLEIAGVLTQEFGETAYAKATLQIELAPQGTWHPLYIEFVKAEGKKRYDEAMHIFKKEAKNAAQVIINALAEAIKNATKTGNWEKATEYAQMVLAFSTDKTLKAGESNDLKNLTDEQLRKLLEQNNIPADIILGSRGN